MQDVRQPSGDVGLILAEVGGATRSLVLVGCPIEGSSIGGIGGSASAAGVSCSAAAVALYLCFPLPLPAGLLRAICDSCQALLSGVRLWGTRGKRRDRCSRLQVDGAQMLLFSHRHTDNRAQPCRYAAGAHLCSQCDATAQCLPSPCRPAVTGRVEVDCACQPAQPACNPTCARRMRTPASLPLRPPSMPSPSIPVPTPCPPLPPPSPAAPPCLHQGQGSHTCSRTGYACDGPGGRLLGCLSLSLSGRNPNPGPLLRRRERCRHAAPRPGRKLSRTHLPFHCFGRAGG